MNFLLNFYSHYFNNQLASVLSISSVFLLLIAIACAIGIIIKQFLTLFSSRVLKSSSSNLYKTLAQRKVFESLFHLGSALIFYCVISLLLSDDNNYSSFEDWLRRISLIYVIFGILWFITKLIRGVNFYYQSLDFAKKYPINSYLEVAVAIAWTIGLILAIAILINRSPWALLTGLGAISAVILLIFKDSISGLIASVEAYVYRIAKVGDWITLQSLNVDGKIEVITVNTVKVRNWDNTIVSFPTSNLMSSSLQNWNGMYELNARRIKKAVWVDARSIKLCDASLLSKLQKLNGMTEIIKQYANQDIPNVSLFRHYLERHLRQHPDIYQSGFTLLVRNLDMTATGLPVEIYAFSKNINWNDYEAIQAGIIDHALAVMGEFELKPYQE
ncbi:MAG: hypothetical protein K0R66_1305 [Gammaproteobacteria bacterium]|jgi:miniconductance mechanosensitive channel|nr:hypothetical protein [Gammaproteobacteria bacterium]